uniref:Uncharacterized protein n=1 Tax=Psilocybe cubensis TaxID=181762 RepID=A0A8H7XSX7_PSICU
MSGTSRDALAEARFDGSETRHDMRVSARRPRYSSANTSAKLGSSGSASRRGLVSGAESAISASTSGNSGNSRSNNNNSRNNSSTGSGSGTTHAPDSDSRRSVRSKSIDKEEIVQAYERFRKLGMPGEITKEVFEELIVASSSSSTSSASATVGSGSGTAGGGTGAADGADGGVGAPSVGAAIVILSKRLVGRQEAARVRGIIAKAREDAAAQARVRVRPASKIRAPSATGGSSRGASASASGVSAEGPGSTNTKKGPLSVLEDPMKVALEQRENAYRGLMGVRKEYEDVRREMLDLDAEKRKLEEDVKEKRRLALLLDVLRKREIARLARFGSSSGGEGVNLDTLLRDLRQQAEVVMKEHNRVVDEITSEVSKITPHDEKAVLQREARRKAAWKYKNTTEVLANLHARHIRCVRSAEMQDTDHRTSVGRDVEARLDEIVDRLGIHDADEKQHTKAMLMEVAQRRLARKQGEWIADSDLDDMHRKVEEKQMLVQEQIDRAAAIGWLCQEYMDKIKLFRTERLGKMLEEEQRRVDGYVDLARDALVKSQDSRVKQDKSFVSQVREVIGTGRHSCQSILEDVQKMVDRVQTSESLLQHECQKSTQAGESWADAGSEERNRRVLERKGSKIEYGMEMVEDIRRLLAESRKLKYI